MNIFVLDVDPKLAARYHMDCHIARQLMTCAQLLSCAHIYIDGIALATNRVPHAARLKREHVTHEWTQWARFNHRNYRWLYNHMQGLYTEYQQRFREVAPYSQLLRELNNTPLAIPRDEFRNDWPLTMPQQFKFGTTVEAYRRYYMNMAVNYSHEKHEVKTVVRWSAPATVPGWWSVPVEEDSRV